MVSFCPKWTCMFLAISPAMLADDGLSLHKIAASVSTPSGAPKISLALEKKEAPKSLGLEHAFKLALERNFDSAMAKENVSLANGQAIESMGRALPQLRLSASLTGAQTKNANLTLEVPLFNLPAIANAAAAQKSLQIVSIQKKRLVERVLFDVHRLYLGAINAQSLLGLAKTQLSLAEKQKGSVARKVDLGLLPAIDLKRSELLVLNALTNLQSREAQAEDALGTLGLTLGMSETFLLEEPQQITHSAFTLPPKILVQQALSNRKDLSAQSLSFKNSKLKRQSEWFALVPSVSMSGSLRSSETGIWGSGIETQADFGFSATWNIFEGGQKIGRLQQQNSHVNRERLKLGFLQRKIKLQTLGRISNLSQQRRARALADQKVALAQGMIAKARRLHDFGGSTNLDLIELSSVLFEAQNNAQTTRIMESLAKIELLYILGA